MNESNGDLILNERIMYLKDWLPIQIHFQLLCTKTLRDDSYFEVNNINVDPCMLHKFISGNFVMRTIMENYSKASNSKSLGCRLKKVYQERTKIWLLIIILLFLRVKSESRKTWSYHQSTCHHWLSTANSYCI
jgi:hypothetical protein